MTFIYKVQLFLVFFVHLFAHFNKTHCKIVMIYALFSLEGKAYMKTLKSFCYFVICCYFFLCKYTSYCKTLCGLHVSLYIVGQKFCMVPLFFYFVRTFFQHVNETLCKIVVIYAILLLKNENCLKNWKCSTVI